MNCLLCVEPNINENYGININSLTWNKLDAETIIEKHLWPMFTFKLESEWICLNCWQILDEFHKFYTRIEKAQINLKEIIRSDSDPPKTKELLSENVLAPEKIESDPHSLSDPPNLKQFLSENLLEPEILLAKAVPFVKQEFEGFEDLEQGFKDEDDVPLIEMPEILLAKAVPFVKQEFEEFADLEKGFKDEDDVPLIEMRQSVEHCLVDDPITESQELIEDPLIRKGRATRGKKRKAKSDVEKPSKLAKHVDRGSYTQSSSKTEPDILQQPNENPFNCYLMTPDNNNTQIRYYYESKVKLTEYDSFIAQHFKLVCCKCQTSAETFEELHRHFQKSHNKKQGYVICCFTKIRDRGCLVDHINLHLNPEYFKCEYCQEIPVHRKGYSNHMKTHEIEYSCNMCDKSFVSRYLFNKHKLVHLSEDEKKFQCDKCDKSFATETCLSVHQRAVHLRLYSKLCEICGQYIPNSERFKCHMEKHEGVVGPSLSCDICGRVMVNKDSLRKHKKTIHTDGQIDYVCHVCLKVSPNKKALGEHIRRVHNSAYNHKCTVCEKAFKRSEHLKDHMGTHTGVGAFKCPWCPKVFSASSSMHLHRKKLHPKEWQEARLKKYSGKLTPNYKPEATSDRNTFALQFG